MTEEMLAESYWQEAWPNHIEAYLAAPPRCGHWLASVLPGRRTSVLEIAGGSCRDSRYLASLGYPAIGTDFDTRTLEFLLARLPDSPLQLRREDAFAFSFPDKSFDASFSNGFWVCFEDDQKLRALLQEQVRVTRKHAIIVVHNAENKSLVDQFRERSLTDSLYNIRFFTPSSLRVLIETADITYRRLSFHKFGGVMDRFYAPRLKGLPNTLKSIAHLIAPRLYAWQSWQHTERIACVVDLS